MSQLTEYKNKYHHYYLDDRYRLQGEYKRWWYNNGQLRQHCFFKDGGLHGEYKEWWNNSRLSEHSFYKDDNDITKEVKELVKDINNITHKEKVLIKLKFGIRCLS